MDLEFERECVLATGDLVPLVWGLDLAGDAAAGFDGEAAGGAFGVVLVFFSG